MEKQDEKIIEQSEKYLKTMKNKFVLLINYKFI